MNNPKIDIPENIQDICREFAELARKHKLRNFGLKFSPSPEQNWGGDIHCSWEWGRHGDDQMQLKIQSSFMVLAHATKKMDKMITEKIQLTPDLLLKLGFINNDGNGDVCEEEFGYMSKFGRRRLIVVFNENGGDQINTYWQENIGMGYSLLTYDIKYLHELRGLYFALFNEAL